MKKIYLSIIALLSAGMPLLAQQEATLHSMQSLPQSHYTNPAFMSQQQFYLGLPGISSTYFSISNSGFNYNSLIERNPETDSLYINLPRLQDGLGRKNYLNNTVQTDLLSMGLKVNARMYLMLNSSFKAHSRFMYPKGLVGLFVHGNAAYLDEAVAFSPTLEHISYIENSIGASYLANRKLTVGARLKYLKGLGNIRTEESDFTLTTDAQTYALQLQGNIQVRTAGLTDFLEGNKAVTDYSLSDFKSNGFAFDLGATYQLNSRLSFGLSALNLGAIRWKHQAREYALQEANINFRGLDAREMANGGDGLEAFITEVQEAFKPEERELEGYSTTLPAQFYLSARYELERNLHASGLLFAQAYNGRFMPGFAAALNKDFGRRLSTSLSYTLINRSHNNVGAGFSFRLTPVQIYLLSDNLISAPIFYRSAKAMSLRAGMNLVFGYRKSQPKLPYAN